jgi:hypothetical protein
MRTQPLVLRGGRVLRMGATRAVDQVARRVAAVLP